MDCSICFENFVDDKKLSCDSCKNQICKICFTKWIRKRTNITCPHCNSKWLSNFIFDNLKAQYDELFMDQYKEMLFQKEVSFIPLTQSYSTAYKNSKLYNKEDDELEYNFELLKSSDCDQINEKSFFKVVIKCIKPNCAGYVMSNNYCCGICNTNICKYCHSFLNENHICNIQDVQSIDLINTDTKSCPNCYTRIHKYEGCDQAYCTQCKTAFSYSTGKIEKGRIHNPHYYEEIQKIKMNNQINVACDDQPTFIIFNSKDQDKYSIHRIKEYNILHRVYVHTIGILENKYNYNIMDDIIDNDMKHIDFYRNIWNRIYYMLEKIDEKEFINIIYTNHKKTNFNNDIYDIISEYINIYKNILINMKFFIEIDFKNNRQDNKDILDNLHCLLKNDVIEHYKNKINNICDFYSFNKNELYNDFKLVTN